MRDCNLGAQDEINPFFHEWLLVMLYSTARESKLEQLLSLTFLFVAPSSELLGTRMLKTEHFPMGH